MSTSTSRQNVHNYGTRDAALNWAQASSEFLLGMGFVKGLSSPCSFFHQAWGVRTVVHGDYFLAEGSGESLETMDKALGNSFALRPRYWEAIPVTLSL